MCVKVWESNLNQAAGLLGSVIVLVLTVLNPFAQAQPNSNFTMKISDVFDHFGLILNISKMKNINIL